MTRGREIRSNGSRPPRVCILSFPMRSSSPSELILNLTKLLGPLCSSLHIVGGNLNAKVTKEISSICQLSTINTRLWQASDPQKNQGDTVRLLTTSCEYMRIQFALLARCIGVARKVDCVIVFVGGPHLVAQIALFRLLGKEVIWY